MPLVDPRTSPIGADVVPLYRVEIAGTGSYLPPRRVTSAQLDERLGLAPGTVQTATGVASRCVAEGESLIDMAAAAARRALDAAECVARDVDCLLFAGSVPYQLIPTTAVLLKKALGFEAHAMPAFDVDATCLGFLAAVDVASAFITCGRYRRVLVVAAEMPSKGLDWSNVKVAGIFGDGAGAMLLQESRSPGTGILAMKMETYTEGSAACVLRAGGTALDPHGDAEAFARGTYFEMDGAVAYRVAADHLPRVMGEVLADAGVTIDDIALAVPHQASATALALMERRLKFAPGSMLNIFADHGNQVSASLPTAIDWARRHGAVKDGSLMLTLGTAAGITLAAAVWRL